MEFLLNQGGIPNCIKCISSYSRRLHRLPNLGSRRSQDISCETSSSTSRANTCCTFSPQRRNSRCSFQLHSQSRPPTTRDFVSIHISFVWRWRLAPSYLPRWGLRRHMQVSSIVSQTLIYVHSHCNLRLMAHFLDFSFDRSRARAWKSLWAT